MKLYKFLHSEHVASLMAGNLLFKSFRTFHDQPFPIGDHNEGKLDVYAGDHVHRTQIGARDTPLGPALQIGGMTSFKNVMVSYQLAPAFIYCFSFGTFDYLSSRMLNVGEDPYDAAVEIGDPNNLVQALRSAVLPDGSPFLSLFNGAHGGRVTYGSRWIAPPITPDDINSAIWRKSTDYAFQREYRVVIGEPRRTIDEEALLIHAPNLAKYLRQVS